MLMTSSIHVSSKIHYTDVNLISVVLQVIQDVTLFIIGRVTDMQLTVTHTQQLIVAVKERSIAKGL